MRSNYLLLLAALCATVASVTALAGCHDFAAVATGAASFAIVLWMDGNLEFFFPGSDSGKTATDNQHENL